ncbi:hypothetical protein EVAR_96693_1 [Eumeta japonica]|uniref:Uncharacterized protein n=1 Tax=Eumeta variegata TaxID=151549 RepID=A0A4C1WJW7_EUMVA|nr:hypothetical protein EVAR_96693_1 [Eumeta japonica]
MVSDIAAKVRTLHDASTSYFLCVCSVKSFQNFSVSMMFKKSNYAYSLDVIRDCDEAGLSTVTRRWSRLRSRKNPDTFNSDEYGGGEAGIR